MPPEVCAANAKVKVGKAASREWLHGVNGLNRSRARGGFDLRPEGE
jgi:hypothetical protein